MKHEKRHIASNLKTAQRTNKTWISAFDRSVVKITGVREVGGEREGAGYWIDFDDKKIFSPGTNVLKMQNDYSASTTEFN